jgi:CRP/FNR family transcriptional regulator, cyclic AMP receptor protein
MPLADPDDWSPAVRDHVLTELARDAVAGRCRFADAVTLPAVVRIAAFLSDQNPDRQVAWPGTQERLARALDLSRVTVNRALTRVSAAGAIRLTRGGVVVADRTRLDARAAQRR